MASGTITGTTSNDNIEVKIEWSSVTRSSDNKSDVTAALYYRKTITDSPTYGTGEFSITINGTKTSASKYLTINTGWVKAVEATVTVRHTTDGSKTITISATGSISGTTLTKTTVSGSATLDKIARATRLNSVSCATKYFDGEITIKYTPKVSSFYNKCKISLEGGTNITSIDLGAAPASSQTVTLTLSDSNLSTIYNELATTDNGRLRFDLLTYSDSTYSTIVGGGNVNTSFLSLYIPENEDTKPTLSVDIAPFHTLTGDKASLYVQGLSKVKATVTASGNFGAKITSREMVVDGNTYDSTDDFTSDYLWNYGTVSVKVIVTDSRGFSQTVPKEITVIPYTKPKILPASDEKQIICVRCDENGTPTESGTHLKIKARRSYSKITADDKQNNFCTIRYRYVISGKKFSGDEGWVDLLSGTDLTTDEISKAVLDKEFSTQTAYTVQVGVIDDLGGSAAVQFVIPTDFITIDCPEEFEGKRIGFFTYVKGTTEDGAYFGLPIFGGSINSLKVGTGLLATETAPIDLNEIKTPGCYYSPGADYSKYIANTPYGTGGFGLEVRELQSKNYIRQTLYYGRTTFIRHWNTTEWSNWLRYMMTTEVDSTAVDFVTDTGVWNTDTGYWQYRKWKSGAVDMNGEFKVTPTTEGNLGTTALYLSKEISISLPFSVENLQFTVSPTAHHLFAGNTNNSTDKQISFQLYRFTDFTDLSSSNIYVRIIASGKLA